MNSPDPFSYVNAQLEAIVKECSERLANIDYDYMMEDIISTKNAAIAELREQITRLPADPSKASTPRNGTNITNARPKSERSGR